MKFSLPEWLARIEKINPKLIDMGLERVNRVGKRLKLLSPEPMIITVGGTNGKGSTVAFLESILKAANLRVATYTSPHLLRFNERIRINGVEVTDEMLCEAFATVESARESSALTYFEFVTLAAFLIFKETPLDVLILEVGMGGRLDAVNIIDADIAIVTSIDLDHEAYLGNTRELISLEKAGIMRPGKPMICGDRNPPAIFTEKVMQQCPYYQLGKDFDYVAEENSWSWISRDMQYDDLIYPDLLLDNAALALQALQLLPTIKDKLQQTVINEGLSSTRLAGRVQRFQLNDTTTLILDVAHNPHAARRLADTLAKQSCRRPVLGIVGMLSDKNVFDSVAPMKSILDSCYFCDLPGPRGLKAEDLAMRIESLHLRTMNFPSVVDAFKHALAECPGTIVVFGSFFTVAPILQQMM